MTLDVTDATADATPDTTNEPGLIEARLAAAYCDTIESCYGGYSTGENALIMLLQKGSDADCVAALRRILFAEKPVDTRILAGELIVDEARLTACISALTSECTLDQEAVCQDYLEGKVELGGECQTSDECVGDAFCDNEDYGCPGHCVARGAAGADCQTHSACSMAGATKLACSFESYHCVPRVSVSDAAVNADCGEAHSADAVTFTHCAANLACEQQVCQPIIASGGTCQDDNSPCAFGTVCVPDPDESVESGTCMAGTFVDVGSDCTEDFVGADPALCNLAKNLGCVDGKCVQGGDGSAGSTCFNVDLQGRCNAGLYCDEASGTCKAKLANGLPCNSDHDCQTDWCDESSLTPTCTDYPGCQ